jgi:hypothetical protein
MHVLNLVKMGEPKLKAFIIDNVFTESECKQLLKLANDNGFSQTQINKYGEEWKDTSLRNNDSTGIYSKRLAKNLYERVKDYLPGSIALNPNIRFNRFRKKQEIAAHVDGEFEEATSKITSKMTFLLYLNSSQGGNTRFLNSTTMKYIDSKPIIGRVLLFDQRLTHAALPVEHGTKYTLRSDVLYHLL